VVRISDFVLESHPMQAVRLTPAPFGKGPGFVSAATRAGKSWPIMKIVRAKL
jgi:hypothetical protein